MYDVIIIGAGVTGSIIAHNLSKYNLKVCVLERHSDVAEGATCANSAVVHSGHDPKSGTLKAKFNFLGNRMYRKFCEELQIEFKEIGAFVVATTEEEEKTLETLINNCIERDIPYDVLTGDEAREIEPNLSDNVSKALSLPTTGMIEPWEVSIASMEEAMLNGVELMLNHEVKKIEKCDDHFKVDDIEGKVVINCAGIYADKIAEMVDSHPYKIIPRKGEYYILDHTGEPLVKHIIYPVPSAKGKGVLAIPTIHNNILLGPNSDVIEDKDDTSTGSGLDYVKSEIVKTMKNIPFNKMIHTYAGIRPTPDTHDFYIKEDDNVKNFIHVGGIESPGLASSPAIAKEVCDNIVLPKFNPTPKENYIRRKPFIRMSKMTNEEKNELIRKDSDFGVLVCRCEKISLGEIKDVINRKCGATTIKGVKKRCRPGMGRCQGGFCEPEVVKILEKELGIDPMSIRQKDIGSEIFTSNAKEDL